MRLGDQVKKYFLFFSGLDEEFYNEEEFQGCSVFYLSSKKHENNTSDVRWAFDINTQLNSDFPGSKITTNIDWSLSFMNTKVEDIYLNLMLTWEDHLSKNPEYKKYKLQSFDSFQERAGFIKQTEYWDLYEMSEKHLNREQPD